MRISTSIRGSLAQGGAAARAQERLRWAFATFASEVTNVRLRVRCGPSVHAELEVHLRGRDEILVATEGRDLDEVVGFLARRARAHVARRMADEWGGG